MTPQPKAKAPRAKGKATKAPARRRPRSKLPLHVVWGPLGPTAVAAPAMGYGSLASLDYEGALAGQLSISEAAHNFWDYDKLRSESQRMDRDNCIYQSLISRVIDMVVGPSIALQARTGDENLNVTLERLWAEWWQSPEVTGKFSGDDMVRAWLRHWLVDGDVLMILPDTGVVQLVPADRIDSIDQQKSQDDNPIDSGIETRDGRIVAFHVCPWDRWGVGLNYSESERIPAEATIFRAHRRRADMVRGEPVLQTVFPLLWRLNSIMESEAAAWQLLSRLAVVIEKTNAAKAMQAFGEDDTTTGDADLAKRVTDLGHSLMFVGEPGENVKGVERNIPGGQFVESLKMYLRLIGMPLGFTLEFTLLLWSDTNYSSGRASIKQVERNCAPWRTGVLSLLSQLYRWKLGDWIRRGKVGNVQNVGVHEFYLSPYPFIDPEKENKSKREAIQGRLSSQTQEIKQDGGDPDAVTAGQVADVVRAIDAANRVKELRDVEISYTHFLDSGTPPPAEPGPESGPEPKPEAANA